MIKVLIWQLEHRYYNQLNYLPKALVLILLTLAASCQLSNRPPSIYLVESIVVAAEIHSHLVVRSRE